MRLNCSRMRSLIFWLYRTYFLHFKYKPLCVCALELSFRGRSPAFDPGRCPMSVFEVCSLKQIATLYSWREFTLFINFGAGPRCSLGMTLLSIHWTVAEEVKPGEPKPLRCWIQKFSFWVQNQSSTLRGLGVGFLSDCSAELLSIFTGETPICQVATGDMFGGFCSILPTGISAF